MAERMNADLVGAAKAIADCMPIQTTRAGLFSTGRAIGRLEAHLAVCRHYGIALPEELRGLMREVWTGLADASEKALSAAALGQLKGDKN